MLRKNLSLQNEATRKSPNPYYGKCKLLCGHLLLNNGVMPASAAVLREINYHRPKEVAYFYCSSETADDSVRETMEGFTGRSLQLLMKEAESSSGAALWLQNQGVGSANGNHVIYFKREGEFLKYVDSDSAHEDICKHLPYAPDSFVQVINAYEKKYGNPLCGGKVTTYILGKEHVIT